MELLKDFRDKDFSAQMAELTRIGSEKDAKYLPDLFSLFTQLTGDKTLDTMIEHTMRDVLSENQEIVIQKLASGVDKEKKICLQVAGNNKFADAVPLMIEMAKYVTDDDLLTDLFIAMSQINDARLLETFQTHTAHSNEMVADISTRMVVQYQS